MPPDHESMPAPVRDLGAAADPLSPGAGDRTGPAPQPAPGHPTSSLTAAERFAKREGEDALKPRASRHRATPREVLDGLLFAFAGLAAIWLAFLLARFGVRANWQALLLIPFWILFTYLLLPRLHRVLTRLYVPGYFIGRARTSDGLLGDPVNLGVYGHEAQIHLAMTTAGWTRADDLTLASGWRIVTSTLSRRSYSRAPVSPLHLFDRQQDFAYQQEVAGNPAKRHHVRFWRCPEDWLLPGGYPVDWLAAGTYDRAVGLSLFTLQVTHKIQADTDIERDFVVDTVWESNPGVGLRVIENFSTGYHSRNGGGDLIETDGDLPILDLRSLDVERLPPRERTDSRLKRPVQTVFGAGAAMLRGIGSLLTCAVLIAAIASSSIRTSLGTELDDNLTRTELVVAAAFLVLVGCLDLVLGVATLRGRNWARTWLMLVSVAQIVIAFSANVQGLETVTLDRLPSLAASILVLLALSSHRARDYATTRG